MHVAIERCAMYKVRLLIRINIHIFGAQQALYQRTRQFR